MDGDNPGTRAQLGNALGGTNQPGEYPDRLAQNRALSAYFHHSQQPDRPQAVVAKHRYVWYLIVNLLTITAVFSLVAIYEKYVPYDSEPYILNGKASFTDLAIYWNILLGFFMTGLNMGIKLLYRSLRDEQQMEELKRQNLQAEMDYLRYQINPHFFMNTLNNIHALIDIDTEYAKSAVIELSKMMRYVLYESGSETISLKKDIQFIENYIELMRIRYDSSIDIRFDYPDSIPNKVAIPPLLLIVFVENAFKHGVSYNHASFIQIRIGYRDDAVTAVISNSRHEKSRSGTTGIGLENVKKRLALIYQDNYTLAIDDSDPAVYTVKLIIPIMPC